LPLRSARQFIQRCVQQQHKSHQSLTCREINMAYRPVARQRLRNKQCEKCSVYSRCYAISG
jgi:hypothetical protein